MPIGANLRRFCRFCRIRARGGLSSHGELKFSLAYGQPCQSSSITIGMRLGEGGGWSVKSLYTEVLEQGGQIVQ